MALRQKIWPDFKKASRTVQWLCLFVVTALFIFILELFKIPAALLLGPMLAAIVIAVSNAQVKVKSHLFVMAQGTVGCMIAQAITTHTLLDIIANWPLFLGGVFSVIIAANLIGYILAKKQVLPGTTAIWGAAPGGASAMVLMAQAYGADERLTAIMQYLRVVLVAALGSLLARLVASEPVTTQAIVWFPPIDIYGFAITLIIAFGGALCAERLRIPAGGMLLPFFIAIFLQNFNIIQLVLPPWFLAISYMMIGWTIGLRFTQSTLRHALKALPTVFFSILLLIVLCALLGGVMSYFANRDLLTTYLATSPGGADSISIIAASTTVDLPFVMAFQTTRFIVVTLTGPFLSRFIANHLQRQGIKQNLPPHS